MIAMQIGVVGGSSATDEQAAWAEEVGARIAEAGAVLVCGGMGGVMESACRGARRAGGVVLGILPGASPDGGNRYITAAAATGMGEARNALVVRSCHAIVADDQGIRSKSTRLNSSHWTLSRMPSSA